MMFTLAISWLTTSNLPWFVNLRFQVCMQYLQQLTLLPSRITLTTVQGFCFGFLFIVSWIIYPLFSSNILGTYQPGEFIFQCHNILPFHTVHGVLKARILKWFAILFSSWPHFVRTVHHDPSVLGGPTCHGL